MVVPSLTLSFLLFLLFGSSDACMRVTPGEPGIPAVACKTCAQTLIMKTTASAGAKVFDTDTTDPNGTCSVRTLTCTGAEATVEVNGGANGAITSPPTVTFVVTCNAAGTAWENAGVAITQLECSVAGP